MGLEVAFLKFPEQSKEIKLLWVSVFGKLKVKTGLRTVCKFASRRTPYLADICSKSKKRNTRAIGEICSKLSINASDLCQWCCSGVFIVSFEEFSHIVLVPPLFTLNKWISGGHWLHTTVYKDWNWIRFLTFFWDYFKILERKMFTVLIRERDIKKKGRSVWENYLSDN